nr:luciferase family protein [Paenibacillus methanolicus]
MASKDGGALIATVRTWPGVLLRPHRFGGTEFVMHGKEIGHIHGVTLVDFTLPKAARDEAVELGKAVPHHVLPNSNWVSVHLRTETDVAHALELLRYKNDLLYDKFTMA